MDLNFKFNNAQQRDFYFSRARNCCFSGGFNNGKTWVGCLKTLTLCATFPKFRAVVARLKYTDLRKTTMQTFFGMCPQELISGHSDQTGVTTFKNGSLIYWMHLDSVDINSLRGLEINSIFIDQAEEIDEATYWIMDSRLGRWSNVEVPKALLENNPDWPRNASTNSFIVPSYNMLACNPESMFHWIYRLYHTESEERRTKYKYIEGAWDSSLGSAETYEEALNKDEEWKAKYIRGEWGASSSQLHFLRADSILDYSDELFARIKEEGKLVRVLDHGDSAPTCCGWFACVSGVYIGYREYYVPGQPISFHRQELSKLSTGEEISSNFADPSIHRIGGQKDGGFWSVANEYTTSDISAPSISWIPADNNEFATRNRINELLIPSKFNKHPVTGVSPAPGLYFLRPSQQHNLGCKEMIKQISLQRKTLVAETNGKKIYSDERDKEIEDHAYDVVRYFVAMHSSQPSKEKPREIHRGMLAYYNQLQGVFDEKVPNLSFG